MPEILIRVRDKLPMIVGNVRHIVAGNSDYTIRFEFDELWDEGEKFVYFVRSRGFVYPKMQTENDSIAVPVQSDVEMVEMLLIGVQQGEIKTSRPCELRILPAITDFIEDGAVQPEKSMWEDHESRITDLEENGTGGGDEIQSDWEQNDPNEKDYIKNRPFYSIGNIAEYLPESTYSFNYHYYGVYCDNLNLPPMVEGQTYTVTIDGETTELIAYTADGKVQIGEKINSGMTNGFKSFAMDNTTMYLPYSSGGGDHLIKVVSGKGEVFPIDEKYIPDSIARLSGVMQTLNPTGVGSFSLNRNSGSEIGDYSTVEGQNCEAEGARSHAEGYWSRADGEASHAEGSSTRAKGEASHAEGYQTQANGYASHAEGGSTADGDYSHAEGKSDAGGYASHSEGSATHANGFASHAEGYRTWATGDYSHAEGSENIEDKEGKYIHIVGNGKNYHPSNAHTLDWNGVPWYQGRPQFGGTAQDNGAQTVMANGDSEIILKSSTEGSEKKFRITVDDSGVVTATEIER